MENFLFVYGSLRSNAPGGEKKQRQYGLTIICPAIAYGFLYDFGPWPGVIFSKDGKPIQGEIVVVNEKNLLRLDIYESVENNLFERIKIICSGMIKEVWAYQVTQQTIDMCKPKFLNIEDWLKR